MNKVIHFVSGNRDMRLVCVIPKVALLLLCLEYRQTHGPQFGGMRGLGVNGFGRERGQFTKVQMRNLLLWGL